MTSFVKVATLSDIPDTGGHCVEVGGHRIGLFRVDDAIHAVDDTCPHAEASLCDGEISAGEVVCPLHFATFYIKTGRCTGPPADEDLRVYPVRINGEDVEIEVDG